MPKRIAFFGTPDFTTSFLDVCEHAGYSPSLIVTNPDAPRGRGQVLTAPAPKMWAEKRGIPTLQPSHLDDAFFEELSNTEWDLFIVIAYGKIIPEKIITLPKYGTINLHYSLLPKYRGASPVEGALLADERETGVSIQQMVFALDAGDILLEEKIPIAPEDTTGTLREKLNKKACEVFPQFLDNLFAKKITPHPQDTFGVSLTKKIKKEEGNITSLPDQEKWRRFRAYTPSPGIYEYIQHGTETIRVKITNARYEAGRFIPTRFIPENSPPLECSYEEWKASLR